MGTLPTQKIEMDLNGTGTLVDVSADVDELQTTVHSWGRTDWTSDTPNPGVLSFTLRNLTGKYTPGNTATYALGVQDGVAVRWTVGGSRVRWFKCQTPSVQWDNNNANSSTVSVTCQDLLGDAARYTMRTLLDEEVLLGNPLWYWRLDDSGSDLTVQPQDSSGNGGPYLSAFGNVADYSWATNSGPAADDGGGLSLNLAATTDPSLGVDYLRSEPAQSAALTGNTASMAVWVAPNVAKTFTGANDYVIGSLVYDAGSVILTVDNLGGVHTYVDGGAVGMWLGQLSLSHTNCLTVQWVYDGTNVTVSSRINGTQGRLQIIAYATIPTLLRRVYVAGADTSVFSGGSYYGYSGSVSRVAVYAGALPSNYTKFYNVGQNGVPELPSARASRIAAYIGATSTAQGTDRGDKCGQQDTSGASALAAMCDALRTEDAAVQVNGNNSGPWVEPWLYSTQRPTSSSMTVDIDADQFGQPSFSFDTSGVANTVTVTGHNLSVVYRYPAPGIFTDHPVTVGSALVTQPAALNLAQYRAVLGRITQVTPSLLTVEVATSPNSLTASLLALRPGSRITVSNLPSGIFGYTSVDVIVAGVTEIYTAETATFGVVCQPQVGTNPAFVVQDATTGRGNATADNYLTSAMTNVATTALVANDSTTHFSNGAAPYTIQIDAEQMTVTAVSVASGHDTLTVTRHVNGTTAAAHSVGALVTLVGAGLLVY